MRLASTGLAELVPNVLWLIEKRLQVLEEVVLDSHASGSGRPDKLEAKERVLRACEMDDGEAEDEAIVDLIRAEMREWWPDFPERRLLTDLYRRAAKEDSADSSRGPTREEGERVARCLLAEVRDIGRLDHESESLAVTETLVQHYLYHPERCQACDMEDMIERSEDSRAYFDALIYLVTAIKYRGKELPVPLYFWWLEYAVGLRRRPILAPVPFQRPVSSEILVRDVQIQFTIKILHRIGVAPRGTHISGCEIVSQVLPIEEDTVIRIWNNRIWEKPLEPVLGKRLEALSERTGLVYDAEISAHPPCV